MTKRSRRQPACCRDMREAFQDAEPAEVRELLEPLVSKIELHYDHERQGKLERNPFKHGTIFVHPTEPQLSFLLGNSEGFDFLVCTAASEIPSR